MSSSISSSDARIAAGRYVTATTAAILLLPMALWAFNASIAEHFYPLPKGLRSADKPLWSFMTLTPGYAGDALRLTLDGRIERTHWRVNRFGWRGPEPDFTRPLVLMSGDSSLVGHGLAEDHSVPALVQKALGSGLTVINAGVPGKAIAHNLLTLEHFIEIAKGEHARPVVFVNWLFQGDLEETSPDIEVIRSRWQHNNLSRFDALRVRFPALVDLVRTYREVGPATGAPALNMLSSAVDVHRAPRPGWPGAKAPIEPFTPSAASLSHLAAMDELARRCGITVLHVVHPMAGHQVAGTDTYVDKVAAALRATGAPHVFSVKDALRRAKPGATAPEFDPLTGHYDAEGARIIAAELSRVIAALQPGTPCASCLALK